MRIRDISNVPGRHVCPTCKQLCRRLDTEEPSKFIGRPPRARQAFVRLLWEEASEQYPMTAEEIAGRLGLQPASVKQYVYRVRSVEGIDVQITKNGGYYIAVED
jgi:biotin operon repressor